MHEDVDVRQDHFSKPIEHLALRYPVLKSIANNESLPRAAEAAYERRLRGAKERDAYTIAPSRSNAARQALSVAFARNVAFSGRADADVGEC